MMDPPLPLYPPVPNDWRFYARAIAILPALAVVVAIAILTDRRRSS